MTSEPSREARAPGLFELVRSDIRRKQQTYVLVDRFFNKYIKIGLQFGTLAVVAYRVGHWAHGRRASLGRWAALALYELLAWPIRWVGRIDIKPRTPIGKGFVIHNFSTIFIDAERVGENFTINQGVTVGPDWKRDGLPSLGANLFLGSGAKVLGRLTVGDNVVVAANCLLARSVGSNCLVAGVPGVVLARDLTQDYVKNVAAQVKAPAANASAG
jgi:serine O-acetyltransferase